MDVSMLTNLPPKILDDVLAYVQYGRVLGGFLKAVFANDLFKSIDRATEDELAALPALVLWLNNAAPIGCHGSYEKVDTWIRHQGQVGLSQ